MWQHLHICLDCQRRRWVCVGMTRFGEWMCVCGGKLLPLGVPERWVARAE
jgi:hypothetical protein